ncbi:MAG: phosphoribosylamine--glycine ligase, partial [Candidatus Methylomirabilales bacterium]
SSEGLRAFGPSRAAATLEGSKSFAKELMQRHGIPTAAFAIFDDVEKARTYVRQVGAPCVIKADGLAAGKGVILCSTVAEALAAVTTIMEDRVFGDAGHRIVVEELLEGEEASFLALTDGEAVLPLAPAQDHKAVFDGDRGPNTGGMGAYSPAPVMTETLARQVMDRIMVPTVRAMAAEGCPYRGVLYAGLMIQNGEAKVLEFNCRFGDPEAQPILVRMQSDLLPLLEATIDQTLTGVEVCWRPEAAVCVVMAAQGYPGPYPTGRVITGLERAATQPDVVVFHAGTALRDGRIVTDGGRVLGVTGLGADIPDAIKRTYAVVRIITWDGVHYRTDIGKKALRRLGNSFTIHSS